MKVTNVGTQNNMVKNKVEVFFEKSVENRKREFAS